MDYWDIYKNAEMSPVFGHSRLLLSARERIRLSNSTVSDYGIPMDLNTGLFRKYSEAERYVLAKGLTYDLMVSLYDVNTSSAFLLRISSPLSAIEFKGVVATLKSLRKPNLEMRVIGLQNGTQGQLYLVRELGRLVSCSLQEVDLFGAEVRNVAFDLKQGMAFDILLLNRAYARGELATKIKKEDFDAQRSEFRLV